MGCNMAYDRKWYELIFKGNGTVSVKPMTKERAIKCLEESTKREEYIGHRKCAETVFHEVYGALPWEKSPEELLEAKKAQLKTLEDEILGLNETMGKKVENQKQIADNIAESGLKIAESVIEHAPSLRPEQDRVDTSIVDGSGVSKPVGRPRKSTFADMAVKSGAFGEE